MYQRFFGVRPDAVEEVPCYGILGGNNQLSRLKGYSITTLELLKDLCGLALSRGHDPRKLFK